MVAGRTAIFSIHQDGSLVKSNFAEKVFNSFELIKQSENEKAQALKISPNKRWLAFCQMRLKKTPKEDEPVDEDNDYY